MFCSFLVRTNSLLRTCHRNIPAFSTSSNVNISINLIKELREKSNAPINECKKALIQTNGDVKAAMDALRAKGIAKAMNVITIIYTRRTYLFFVYSFLIFIFIFKTE
jgi:hypothetical protein